jgi:hypothetical protein
VSPAFELLGKSSDPKARKRAEETEPLGRRIGRSDPFTVAGVRLTVTRSGALVKIKTRAYLVSEKASAGRTKFIRPPSFLGELAHQRPR